MIVDAALPLILEHGERVTTRQIADAAGIAEGTIFRAFTDKDEVIKEALATALDPAPLEVALELIDVNQSLEKCLDAAITAIQTRVFDTWKLMSAVGPRFHPEKRTTPQPVSLALTRIFEAHKERLSLKPTEASKRLRAVTLALTHPMLNDQSMSPKEVAKQFLYGVAVRNDQPC